MTRIKFNCSKNTGRRGSRESTEWHPATIIGKVAGQSAIVIDLPPANETPTVT
jgi:hypothetical protein